MPADRDPAPYPPSPTLPRGAAPPRPVFVNGKFAAQRTTGVQRVAAQLLLALDAQVPAGGWTLLCPPQARPPALQRIAVQRVGPPGLPLHLWEQAVLPWAARGGWLLSLAGAAPALARRQVAVLHDAAVFDHPEAYTRAFVAWYRWLFRRLARRAAGVMTVSAFSRDRLAAALAVPPARLAVLPPGADHLQGVAPDGAILDRHGLRGRTFLLAVGSSNPTKNLDALVAAFARLGASRSPAAATPASASASSPLLVIAGGANARVFAGAAAADPPGVVRTGPVDDGALVALYGHARALVFPSLYEGFGLPPLEAMACGCPVAAARAASIPEACGDAALYFDPHVDPRHPAALDAALQALLHDDALCARLRAAGRVHAAGRRWADAGGRLRAHLRTLGVPA